MAVEVCACINILYVVSAVAITEIIGYYLWQTVVIYKYICVSFSELHEDKTKVIAAASTHNKCFLSDSFILFVF